MALEREPAGGTGAPRSPDAAPRGTGRATRWRIGVQVVLASLLFVALVVLATWLAERPGLRVRFDLTRDGTNTLSESSAAVIGKLPTDVAIDVFFRPAEPPFDAIGYDVQGRMRHLLVLARDAAGDRIRIEEHDLLASRGGAARAETRMRELGLREIEPGGVVVASAGPRTAVMRFRGDLADLDPGDPEGRLGGPPRPARLVSFRGEEALVSALLRVADGGSAKVLFSVGHGELDVAQPDIGGLTLLARELERDGFVVDTWNGEKSAAIGEDVLVLALVGPEQPLSPGERAEVERFVASGGRLIVAPGFEPRDDEHSLVSLMKGYGIEIVTEGFVARPISTATGQWFVGRPECSDIVVSRTLMNVHPLTEPLRRGDRRVALKLARSLLRTKVLAGGTLLDLFRSPDESWRDVSARGGPLGHDWAPGPDETLGPFVLAMATVFPPSKPVAEERARQVGARPETRLLCVGSASAFANESFATNRDFLLNAFNWAAARDFRVSVRARDVSTRRIDVTSGNALAVVNLVAVGLLPLACLGLGLWTAWRRARR